MDVLSILYKTIFYHEEHEGLKQLDHGEKRKRQVDFLRALHGKKIDLN
jgi:hypothetical protein